MEQAETSSETPHSQIDLRTLDISDISLRSQSYYPPIRAKLQRDYKEEGKEPTIGRAIEIMRGEGNVKYTEMFPSAFKKVPENETIVPDKKKKKETEKPESKKEKKEVKFKSTSTMHEVSHLIEAIPHTPQHEQNVLPHELGLTYGVAVRSLDPEARDIILNAIKGSVDRFMQDAKEYQTAPVTMATKNHWAIQFALGLYRREKIDQFREKGMMHQNFEAQQQFCQEYSKYDHKPPKRSFMGNYDGKDILDAPVELLELTKAERKAIISAALGQKISDTTPYAERLKPIVETLKFLQFSTGKSEVHALDELYKKYGEQKDFKNQDGNKKDKGNKSWWR